MYQRNNVAKKVIVHEHKMDCKINAKIILSVFLQVNNVYGKASCCDILLLHIAVCSLPSVSICQINYMHVWIKVGNLNQYN